MPANSIAEPWRTSRGNLSSGTSGTRYPEGSARRKSKRPLPPGSWTSTRCFRSSMCVPSLGWRMLLTRRSQKELVTRTSVAVPVVRHDTMGTRTTVSGVQGSAPNARTDVSSVDRNTTQIPQDTRSKGRVSTARTPPIAEQPLTTV